MGKTYQQENPKSTTYSHPIGQAEHIPISERFRRRAEEKREAGEPYDHWVRAARIIARIERGLPVGNLSRRWNRRDKGATI